MILIVKEGKVLHRIDAWLKDSEKMAKEWIYANGYIQQDIYITFGGDMVINVF